MNNPLLRVSLHAATPCCYHFLVVRTYASLVVLHDPSPEIVPYPPSHPHHEPTVPNDKSRGKSNHHNQLNAPNHYQPNRHNHSQNPPNKNNSQTRQPNLANAQNRNNRSNSADTHHTQPNKEQPPRKTYQWNRPSSSAPLNQLQQTNPQNQSTISNSHQPKIDPQSDPPSPSLRPNSTVSPQISHQHPTTAPRIQPNRTDQPNHPNQPKQSKQLSQQNNLNQPYQLNQPKQLNQPSQPNQLNQQKQLHQPNQLNQPNKPNQPNQLSQPNKSNPNQPKQNNQPQSNNTNHTTHTNQQSTAHTPDQNIPNQSNRPTHANQPQEQNILPNQDRIRTPKPRSPSPNPQNQQSPQQNQLPQNQLPQNQLPQNQQNRQNQQNQRNRQNRQNQRTQQTNQNQINQIKPSTDSPTLQNPTAPNLQTTRSSNCPVPPLPSSRVSQPPTNNFPQATNSPLRPRSPALQTPKIPSNPPTPPRHTNPVSQTANAPTNPQSPGTPILQTQQFPESPISQNQKVTTRTPAKSKPPVTQDDQKARLAFKTARAEFIKSNGAFPFMEVVDKFKHIQNATWHVRDDYFSFLVWGTDPKAAVREFLQAKSIAPVTQLSYMYTRMLYFLAYMRSTEGKESPANSPLNYELCDECLASMRKDGIVFGPHVYSALLLHVDPHKRAQIFAQMYNDGVPCDESLLALALLSGDMACAADAVKLLHGRAWLRFRATSWYIYLRARKTAASPPSTEDWPKAPTASRPTPTPLQTSETQDPTNTNSETTHSEPTKTDTNSESTNLDVTDNNTTKSEPTKLAELTIPLARVKELALYLIAQGDEAGCAGMHSDLAAQGVQPFTELYDALLRFASQRNDAQTIDALLAEKEYTGLPTTLDDYRALLAESDAWVRPAPPVVTQLVYVPPYLPYFHPQDPPLENPPPFPEPHALQKNLEELVAQKNLAGAHALVRSLNGPAENLKGLYETLLTAAAREFNVQMCRALLDEFAQQEDAQRSAATQPSAETTTISADVRSEVMAAMNKRSQWDDSLRVFYEMRARGLKPTTQACAAAGLALRHSKETGRARRVFEILREYGITASPTLYSFLLIAAASDKDVPTYNAVWAEMEAHGKFVQRTLCNVLIRQFQGERTWEAQARELSRKMTVWWADSPRSPHLPSASSPPSPPSPSSPSSSALPRSSPPSSPPSPPSLSSAPPPPSPSSPSPHSTRPSGFSAPQSPFSRSPSSPPSSSPPSASLPSSPPPNLTAKPPQHASSPRVDPRRAKSAQPFPLDLYFTPTPPRIQDFFKKCKEIPKEGAEREKLLAELKKERNLLDKECVQTGNERYRGDMHCAWLIAVGLEKTEESFREARRMGVKVTRFMLNRLIAFYETKGDLDGMLRAKSQLVEAGFAPNSATYVPILAQLLTRRDRAGFERELAHMPVELTPEVYVPIARARAISALLRRDAVDSCVGILNDAGNASTQALNAGLADACAHGLGAQCLSLLPKIRKRIVKPDGVTYAAMSNCLSLEKVHVVCQFYTYAKLATQMTDHAYALFACAFARSDPARVRAVLRDLRESKLRARSATFDPILDYYATSRDVKGFTEVLAEMRAMKIQRDIGTLRIQMNLYASVGDVKGAKEMLRQMHEEGIGITPHFLTFYNPFLSLLATHGDPAGCAQVLADLRAQHGSHMLAKYYVYGSLYISLLAFSGSRSIVLRLYKSGVNNIQKLIEETLRQMKGP